MSTGQIFSAAANQHTRYTDIMTGDQIPYLNEIPAEHIKRGDDGEVLLTELGVIHLCTLVEQRHPEKAALVLFQGRIVG